MNKKKLLYSLSLLCVLSCGPACGMEKPELCDDVWMHIFGYVNKPNWHFKVGRLICKDFNNLLVNQYFKQKCRPTLEIKLSGTLWRDVCADSFKKKLQPIKNLLGDKRLISLSFPGYFISREQFKVIVHLFKNNLQTLNRFESYQIRDRDLKYLVNLTNLQHLNLCGCDKITGTGLECLADNLKHLLQTLNLSTCRRLAIAGGRGLKYLVANLPRLRTLDLSWCRGITDEVIEELKKINPQLEIIKQ